MRGLMLTLHKYAGLTLGLVVSVIGITGSLLVFDHAIDEALTQATITADDPGRRAPLADVLSAARAATGGELDAYRIYIARKPGSPHVVRFREPSGEPGPIEVSVAAATAEVLVVRTWGQYPASWVYNLHFTLLAGDTGKTIVGLLGLLLLFFCISGVVIWWPRDGRWRRALTIRRGRGAYNFNFDLHKTAGLYLLPILAVVSFSGVAIVFSGQVQALVSAVLPMDDYPSPHSRPRRGTITVDQAVAAAATVFPDGELKRVHLPTGDDGSFQLFFNTPAEPWSNLGASVVWVDAYDAAVLDSVDVSRAAAGTQFMRWQFPLHNGDALGLAGRWLVFVVGWLPALLFGTGVYTWWRKRRVKRVKRGRSELRALIRFDPF